MVQSAPAPKAVEQQQEVWYHYILVRKDLPTGTQGAMIAHAAGESGAAFGRPLSPHTRVVVLAPPSQGAIKRLSKLLTEQGIAHNLIEETEGEFADQAMAIGIPPTNNREAIRRLTSSLPLLK